MEEYCICGHLNEEHKSKRSSIPGCGGCWDSSMEWQDKMNKAEHAFKLDNLKLIEDLAKEKGLV
jgi:hypothetical protein